MGGMGINIKCYMQQMNGRDLPVGGIRWEWGVDSHEPSDLGRTDPTMIRQERCVGLSVGESVLPDEAVLIAPLMGDGWYSYAGEQCELAGDA